MEEKKLTDEEILKDIERSTGMPSYWKKIVLDLINRKNGEIERLTEDRNQLALCNKGLQDGINEYQADNAEIGRRNAELQKQVDELKEKIMNLKSASGNKIQNLQY